MRVHSMCLAHSLKADWPYPSIEQLCREILKYDWVNADDNIIPNLEASLFGPVRKRPAKLPSWVEYQGNVSESDLFKLYNSASIYLCSSAAESFALPPAEAMARVAKSSWLKGTSGDSTITESFFSASVVCS